MWFGLACRVPYASRKVANDLKIKTTWLSRTPWRTVRCLNHAEAAVCAATLKDTNVLNISSLEQHFKGYLLEIPCTLR